MADTLVPSLAEQAESAVSQKIAAYRSPSPEFIIYWPDGEPITCRKPTRAGARRDVVRAFGEWRDFLHSPRLSENPALFAAVNEYQPFPTDEELFMAWLVHSFSTEPKVTDVEAVKMIGADDLLWFLHQQIESELETTRRSEFVREVNEQGESSAQTIGNTSESPSAPTTDSETPTP